MRPAGLKPQGHRNFTSKCVFANVYLFDMLEHILMQLLSRVFSICGKDKEILHIRGGD